MYVRTDEMKTGENVFIELRETVEVVRCREKVS